MEIELNTPNNKGKKDKGVTTVEYAVMLVLVAIVVLVAAPGIGSGVTSVFSSIVTHL